MKVFVSSTVYDLIDVRAELESHLRLMGLVPVMSDSATSDFRVQPDRNSIEACLVNLEQCDTVLVVLCRRYGGNLENAGFDRPVSATELEYEHAMKNGKPVHVFVRDRLEADYRLWRAESDEAKRQSLSFAWVKGEKDRRLFDLLNRHQQLDGTTNRNNWYSTFQDSLDLKAQVSHRLSASASRAQLDVLLATGNLPTAALGFQLQEDLPRGRNLFVTIQNVGPTPMINSTICVRGFLGCEPPSGQLPWLAPNQQVCFELPYKPPFGIAEQFSVTCQYATSVGHRCRDEFEVTYETSPLRVGASFAKAIVSGGDSMFRVSLVRREFAPASPGDQLFAIRDDFSAPDCSK